MYRNTPDRGPSWLTSVLFLGISVACGSSRVPPRLPPNDLNSAGAVHFGGSVAVEADNYPVYSDQLKQQLERTHLFDQVDSANRVPSPTLIARVERHVHGRAVIPLWTALSLGLIPTIFTEEHGLYFSLRRPDDPAAQVVVDATYSGRSTIGWLGLLESISPDYSARRPEATDRYASYFRWATASKVRELLGTQPE